MSWRCFAVVGSTGVIATYTLLARLAPEHEPLLRAIVDGVELVK